MYFFQQNMSDLIDIYGPTNYLWHVERYKTFSKWPFKKNARCLPAAVSLNCTQIFYLNKAIPLQLVCCNLPYNTDVAKQLSKRTIHAILYSPLARFLQDLFIVGNPTHVRNIDYAEWVNRFFQRSRHHHSNPR